VAVPEAVLRSPRLLNVWLRKSLGYAAALPPKTAKAKTKGRAKRR